MKSRIALSILLILSLAISSCALAPAGNKTSTLKGKVFLDKPIVGADLRITDAKGEELFKVEKATSKSGTFMIAVEVSLPEDYRLEASGGTYGDQVFADTLSVRVQGSGAGGRLIYINPATTILARYMDENKTASYADAKRKITAFLGLSQGIDLGSALAPNGRLFNYRYFLAQATSNGGLDAYLDKVVAAVDSPAGGKKMSFKVARSENIGPVALWLFGVAKDWAKGILIGAGKNLSVAGAKATGNNPIGGAVLYLLDREGQEREAYRQELVKMNEQLTLITQQMSLLQDQLAAGTSAILTQDEKNAYETRAAVLESKVSEISALNDRLAWLIESSADSNLDLKSETANLKSEVKSKVLPAMKEINSALVGTGTVEGLIPKWCKLVTRKSPFLDSNRNASFRNNYTLLEDQFTYYGLVQLTALNLIVEVYNSENNKSTAQKYIDTYTKNMKAQTDMWLKNVEVYVIEGSEYKWHATTDPQNLLMENATMQVSAGQPLHPSEVLQSADGIVDTLLGQSASNIRVRVIEARGNTFRDFHDKTKFNGKTGFQVEDVALSLTKADGSPLSPSEKPRLSAQVSVELGTGKQDTTYNWVRYTFKDLAPGNYTLTDINSKYPLAFWGGKKSTFIHPPFLPVAMPAGEDGGGNLLFYEYSEEFINGSFR